MCVCVRANKEFYSPLYGILSIGKRAHNTPSMVQFESNLFPSFIFIFISYQFSIALFHMDLNAATLSTTNYQTGIMTGKIH